MTIVFPLIVMEGVFQILGKFKSVESESSVGNFAAERTKSCGDPVGTTVVKSSSPHAVLENRSFRTLIWPFQTLTLNAGSSKTLDVQC